MCSTKTIPVPAAAPIPKTVTEQDPAVIATMDRERRRLAGQQGSKSTLLTAGFTPQATPGKTLLGA